VGRRYKFDDLLIYAVPTAILAVVLLVGDLVA
jgi:hypothetical protein